MTLCTAHTRCLYEAHNQQRPETLLQKVQLEPNCADQATCTDCRHRFNAISDTHMWGHILQSEEAEGRQRQDNSSYLLIDLADKLVLLSRLEALLSQLGPLLLDLQLSKLLAQAACSLQPGKDNDAKNDSQVGGGGG